MAKIPLIGLRTRVNPNPTVDPTKPVSQAGIKEKAFGQLAGQVTNFVSALEERRAQAEIVDYRNNSVSTFNRESRKKLESLREEHAGTDFRGYSKTYSDWQKEILGGIRSSAPTPRALQAFNTSIVASENNRLRNAEDTERFNRSKVAVASDRNRTVEMAQDALINPNLTDISSGLTLEVSLVEANRELFYNGRKDATEAIINEKIDAVRRGAIQGVINQDLIGVVTPGISNDKQIKEIDNFLAGKDPQTKILFKGMSAQESKSYRTQMINSLKSGQKQLLKGLKEDVKNLTVINMEPVIDADSNFVLSNQVASKLTGIPDSKDKEDLIREIDLSIQAGDLIRATNTMPQEDFLTFKNSDIPLPEKTIANAADVKKYEEMVKSSIGRIDRMRANKPKEYVRGIVGTLPHAELFRKQEKLGLPNPQFLDKNEATLESSKILEAQGVEQKVLELNNFKNKHGMKMARIAFDEMEEVNSLFGAAFTLAAEMDNIQSQKVIISNASDNSIKKNFDADPLISSNRSNLNLHVDRELRDLDFVYSAFRNNKRFQEVREAVVTESMRIFMDPFSSTRNNVGGSVKKAVKTIVNSSMVPVVDRSINRKFMVIAPTDIERDAESLEESFDKLFLDENLRKFGISPRQFQIQTGGTEEDFFDLVRENSTIVNSPKSNGVSFLFRNDSLGEENLLTRGKKTSTGFSPLKDIDGEIIVIPWELLP